MGINVGNDGGGTGPTSVNNRIGRFTDGTWHSGLVLFSRSVSQLTMN